MERKPFKHFDKLQLNFDDYEYELKPYESNPSDVLDIEEVGVDKQYNVPIVGEFSSVTINSRGITLTEKGTNKKIFVKSSCVQPLGARGAKLIFMDVQLYTPFIPEESGVIKFISWEEWDKKYSPEGKLRQITDPNNLLLKEQDSDLGHILKYIDDCAATLASTSTMFVHRMFMPVYRDNEYLIDGYDLSFKWNTFINSRYEFLINYRNDSKKIGIMIRKLERDYDPHHLMLGSDRTAVTTEQYNIVMIFDEEYNITEIEICNKDKSKLLKFIDDVNGAPLGYNIRNAISSIRDYLNCKLGTSKMVDSKIDYHNGIYAQHIYFKQRFDIPNTTGCIPPCEEKEDCNVEPTQQSDIIDYIDKHFCPCVSIRERGNMTVDFDSKSHSQRIYIQYYDAPMDFLSINISDGKLTNPLKICVHFDSIGNIETIDVGDQDNIHSKIQFKELNDFIDELEKIFGHKLFEDKFSIDKTRTIYGQIKKELIGIFNDEPNCSTEVFTSENDYKRYRTVLKLGDNSTETLHFYYEDNRKKLEIHVSGVLHYVDITIICDQHNTLESISVSGLKDVEHIRNRRVKNLIEELVKLSQN